MKPTAINPHDVPMVQDSSLERMEAASSDDIINLIVNDNAMGYEVCFVLSAWTPSRLRCVVWSAQEAGDAAIDREVFWNLGTDLNTARCQDFNGDNGNAIEVLGLERTRNLFEQFLCCRKYELFVLLARVTSDPDEFEYPHNWE